MASSEFIIAAHGVCDSCNGHSGPTFSLRPLSGPSSAHRTNETLNGVELQSRLDDIRDTQLEIDKFDTEIVRLTENLKGLEHRRAELVNYKNQELSLFSPIRSLPDDVLKHIFMMCQESEDHPGYIDFGIGYDTFVQRVTAVSNYWRNVALSMPVLWSRVSFACLDGMEHYMDVSPGEFVERCLMLSGSVPFSIEFGENCDLINLLGERCLKKLAEAAHRWENISVDRYYGAGIAGKWSRIASQSDRILQIDTLMKYVPKDTVFSSLKTIGPIKTSTPIAFHSTPVLECVWVKCGDPSTTNMSFLSAPSLRYADTTGYLGSPYDALPHFPWQQITNFQCQTTFTSNHIATLLNSMSSLVEFNLILNTAIELPTSTHIMLPLVEKFLFSLHRSDDVGYTEPLKFFTMPALKELTVVGDCDSDVMLGLIRRSGCHIERLTLRGGSLPGKWDISEMKKLKYLNVNWPWSVFRREDDRDDVKGVMKVLTWKTSGKRPKNVFPQLDTLEFYFPGMFILDNPFPMKEFKAMVSSRLPPKAERKTRRIHAALKSLKLMFQYLQDVVTTGLIDEYLHTLRESGIRAVIEYEEQGFRDSNELDSDTDSVPGMELDGPDLGTSSEESASD